MELASCNPSGTKNCTVAHKFLGSNVNPCTRQLYDKKYIRHKVDKSLTFIPASLSALVLTTIRCNILKPLVPELISQYNLQTPRFKTKDLIFPWILCTHKKARANAKPPTGVHNNGHNRPTLMSRRSRIEPRSLRRTVCVVRSKRLNRSLYATSLPLNYVQKCHLLRNPSATTVC
jgi:hypothetical protein